MVIISEHVTDAHIEFRMGVLKQGVLLVLAFYSPPFEAFAKALLQDLALNTVFLEVLTSYKCGIEVNTFSYYSVTFSFSASSDCTILVQLLEFLATNQHHSPKYQHYSRDMRTTA